MDKNTRATNQPRDPERITCRTNSTGPYRTNVANNGATIRTAMLEHHRPKSCWRVRKNVGTTSNAHTTQKSRVKRNGRSTGCIANAANAGYWGHAGTDDEGCPATFRQTRGAPWRCSAWLNDINLIYHLCVLQSVSE